MGRDGSGRASQRRKTDSTGMKGVSYGELGSVPGGVSRLEVKGK